MGKAKNKVLELAQIRTCDLSEINTALIEYTKRMSSLKRLYCIIKFFVEKHKSQVGKIHGILITAYM